jgi:hypothetical protein
MNFWKKINKSIYREVFKLLRNLLVSLKFNRNFKVRKEWGK